MPKGMDIEGLMADLPEEEEVLAIGASVDEEDGEDPVDGFLTDAFDAVQDGDVDSFKAAIRGALEAMKE